MLLQANQCQSTTPAADGRYSCRVDLLPAGTPCAFRVRSGNAGGWSSPSELTVAQTIDSDSSRAARQQQNLNLIITRGGYKRRIIPRVMFGMHN